MADWLEQLAWSLAQRTAPSKVKAPWKPWVKGGRGRPPIVWDAAASMWGVASDIEIAAAVGCLETSASARLRCFRQQRFVAVYGEWQVTRKRLRPGLWAYRLERRERQEEHAVQKELF